MEVETVSEATDTGQGSGLASQFRTGIAMTVVAPVAHAALFNLSYRIDDSPFDGPDGVMIFALFALKLLTVISLVVGLHRIGAQVAASPALAWMAAGIWSSVGTVLVAVVASAKNQGASLGIDHLWPGQSDPELLSHLDPGPGLGWNATSIVTAEILAVASLSVGVALILRFAAGRLERRFATGLTMASFLCGLLVYDRIVGWPVLFDFDPFVGDAVLGVLTYELTVLPGPVDPLGAITLAAIAAANGLILVVARWVPSRR